MMRARYYEQVDTTVTGAPIREMVEEARCKSPATAVRRFDPHDGALLVVFEDTETGERAWHYRAQRGSWRLDYQTYEGYDTYQKSQ